MSKNKSDLEIKRQNEIRERAASFRRHIDSIRAGSANSGIFYELARAYDGKRSDVFGNTPDVRLKDVLNHDQELVDAAYMGFKRVLERKDLPQTKDIIRGSAKGETYVISPACLIAVDMLYKNDPASILKLNDDLLSRLLAFYFAYDIGEKDKDAWVIYLIAKRPEIVISVLTDYLLAMTRAKREIINPLFRMIIGDDYSTIAPEVLPVILSKFPLRVSYKVSENVLVYLLKGAIKYQDKINFVSIIDERLKNSSMDGIQKVYWLACGFRIDSAKYINMLLKHVAENESYKHKLANFIYLCFGDARMSRGVFANIDGHLLGLLTEYLASEFSPDILSSGVAYEVAPQIRGTYLVRDLIAELRSNPDKKASELERLLSIEELSLWHNTLDEALSYKRFAQSTAAFKYMGRN